MVDLNDIQSLTDFQRNTKDYLKKLKQTGKPLALTVNGKAEIIVQDAASYQQMLDVVEYAEAVAGIQRGLEQVKEGKTKPAKQVFQRLRKKHKLTTR